MSSSTRSRKKLNKIEICLIIVPLLIVAALSLRHFFSRSFARQFDRPFAVIRFGGEEARDVSLSPNGTMIAIGHGNLRTFRGAVHVYDVETGSLRYRIHEQDTWGIDSLSFSPDGKFLTTNGRDGQWLSQAMTGRFIRPLQLTASALVRFSPDGRLLASQLGALCDVQTGRKVRSSYVHASSASDLAFSPDGRQLATVTGTIYNESESPSNSPKMQGGQVQLWDVKTGKSVHIAATQGVSALD